MPASRIEKAAPLEGDRINTTRQADGITVRPSSQAAEVVPSVLLFTALRFWWIIFAVMVLGGLAGLVASGLLPPVYESIAYFPAAIDYAATGPLSQFEEDTAYNAVGAILSSQDVRQQVIDQASQEGYPLTLVNLRQMSFLERRFDVWEVRVRGADPVMTRRVAEIWNEIGQQTLVERYRHAVQADLLNRYAQTLEDCLGKSVASEPSVGLCSRYRFAELQNDLRETGQALYNERVASGGLFAGLQPGPPMPVTSLERPVQYGRGQLVLAGSMIGLVVGLVLVETGLPTRWARKAGQP